MNGAPRETDQWRALGQPIEDLLDGIGNIAGAFLRRGSRQPRHVGRAAQGVANDGADVRHVVEVEPHRHQYRQQVPEHDRRVGTENALGVEGRAGGQVRCGEELEAGRIALQGVIFGHVATGLAVQPDGGAVGRLPPACLEEPRIQLDPARPRVWSTSAS